jgi:hypothetical protein
MNDGKSKYIKDYNITIDKNDKLISILKEITHMFTSSFLKSVKDIGCKVDKSKVKELEKLMLEIIKKEHNMTPKETIKDKGIEIGIPTDLLNFVIKVSELNFSAVEIAAFD